MNTKTLLTSDDLWKIVADGSRYELSDGELIPMTPVGFQHSAIVGRLGEFLSRYVRENNLGIVGMEGGFKLQSDPQTLRAPDIHFVSKDRLAKEGITQKFAEYPPNLAVEVISPEDKASDVLRKVEEYLSAGVPLVWIVDPIIQRVAAYRSLQDVRILTPDQELDGGEILPGFHIKVGDIFAL